MSIPEFVIQEGIRRAWRFLQDRSFVFGHLLQEYPPDRQREYRRLVEEETPAILFQYPSSKAMVPAFSIILLNDTETSQTIGDDGISDRSVPYPAVAPSDFYEQERFYGIVYDEDMIHGGPTLYGVDGERDFSPTKSPENHPLRRKNLSVQNPGGDEQRERMGHVQRLYNRDQQRLATSAVADQIDIGIIVSTGNAELTSIYYRLLRWVLRRFSTWFHIHGLQNAIFSGTDLTFDELSAPTTAGSGIFQRQLRMSFLYEDRAFEVESILEGWMLEIEMVTRRPDGGLDVVPLFQIETEE